MPQLQKKPPRPQQRTLRLLLHVLPKSAGIFLVGGTVRDLLLCRPTKDMDILVTGMSLGALERALRPHGTLAFVGARFGVLKFQPAGTFAVDIALPRTEHSFGTGKYRDFAVRSDPALRVEDDLQRRDFTINAMAHDVRSGVLLDPFGAQRDLRRKTLRTVGKPADRFAEDYSRLLRLLRFAVTLGFRIEPRTASAAQSLMPRLMAKHRSDWIVPREVIAEQLLRALAADPVAAFDLFDRFGVFRTLMPEVDALRRCNQDRRFHREGDVLAHTRLLLQKLTSSAFVKEFGDEKAPLVVAVAGLLHDIGKPATQKMAFENGRKTIHFLGHERFGSPMATALCRRLQLSSYGGLVHASTVAWLVRHHKLDLEMQNGLSNLEIAKRCTGERGRYLLQLIWADRAASVEQSGKSALAAYRSLKRRLARMVTRDRAGIWHMPRPLLNGHEVQKVLRRASGQHIGAALNAVLERQLAGRIRTKRQAVVFLRHHHG